MGAVYSLTWAGAQIDNDRQLVVSPKNGRSYIIRPGSEESGLFLRLAGLGENTRTDHIEYVSSYTIPDKPVNRQQQKPSGYRAAKLFFSFTHLLRSIISPRVFVAMAAKLGRLRLFHVLTTDDIIRLVRSVEKENDFESCFARSVLLLALASEAGLAASMFIGVLAPCTKMHAWTVIDESMLYEQAPEHWMYFPVLRFRLCQEYT